MIVDCMYKDELTIIYIVVDCIDNYSFILYGNKGIFFFSFLQLGLVLHI